MKKTTAFFLALLPIMFSFVSCGLIGEYKTSSNYIDSSGWYCPEEEFYNEYFDLIEDKIQYLQAEYDINSSCEVDKKSNNFFILTLYNEKMTCEFKFSSHIRYGLFEASLYFFSYDEQELDDYNIQKKYVDFLNDVTHFVSFDMNSEMNIYEDAYNHCSDSKRLFNQLIYEDSLVGNLEFGVSKKCEGFRQYYKFEADTTTDFKCNYFYCRSLLSGDLKDKLEKGYTSF